VAVHERGPAWGPAGSIPERGYRANAHNVGYIAGKLLRRGDAAGALVALVSRNVRDGVRMDRVAFKGVLDTLSGFARGLRQRQPVRREVSRAYRRNFETFANPWSASRTLRERVRDALGRPARGPSGRRERWLAERSRFYPERRGVLEL
jgi:hypothetical protein